MPTHDPQHTRRTSSRRRRAARARRRAGLRPAAGRASKRHTSRFLWPVIVLIAQAAIAVIQLIAEVLRVLEP